MNPIATAQYGMLAATRRFEASAQRTAQAGSPNASIDMVSETVEQIQAKHAYSANLGVIRTANQMTRDALNMIV